MEKETTINELMEFLAENMVTKQEFSETIKSVRSEMATGFEELRTEMTAGFRMIREELDDIKNRLEKLEKRTLEDADASARDVLELRQRVDMLEKQVRQLQTIKT